MDFSDYVVYVDESGDPRLTGYNPQYPVFVLAFCIFHKKHYTNTVVKNVQNLKFRYFGHDMVILHERDILKNTGQFKDITRVQQQSLLNDLTVLMDKTKFIVIACVIHKDKLSKRYANPQNPYHLGIQFGLERLYNFLEEKKQLDKKTHIIFEQRGLNEDNEVRSEFLDYCQGNNHHRKCYPFELIMASKKVNSTGLQFADLIARPIGNHVLRPSQGNRAFEVIKHKLYCKYGREFTGTAYEGFGLKVFP